MNMVDSENGLVDGLFAENIINATDKDNINSEVTCRDKNSVPLDALDACSCV